MSRSKACHTNMRIFKLVCRRTLELTCTVTQYEQPDVSTHTHSRP